MATRRHQVSVAYLGPEHTFTHQAAQARFRTRGVTYVHAPTIEDVFQLVERGQVGYGVVPIENSLEGAVRHTLDRYIDVKHTPAKILGEIEQRVAHYLIVRPGTTLSDVRIVFSHPQALAQCRAWIEKTLHEPTLRETHSTADAVEYLLRKRQNAWDLRARAAIGRRELAQDHALRAVEITEKRENKTRFLIIGLGEPRRGRRNKTSILCALTDKPGALYDALAPFKRHRINLTKIESRPSKRRPWEYLFFIDFEGHQAEPRVGRALEALRRCTSMMRVLGSYPV